MLLVFLVAYSTQIIKFGVDYYLFWVLGQELQISDQVPNFQNEEVRETLDKKYLLMAYAPETSQTYKEAVGHVAGPDFYNFSGTPFFYKVISWISTGDYQFDLRVFQFINLLGFLFGIFYISRRWGYSIESTFVALAFFTYLFDPFWSDIRVTNVSQLQLGLISLYLIIQHYEPEKWKGFLSGAFLSALVLFKPNIILVLLTIITGRLFFRRYRRFFLEIIGVICGVILVSFVTDYTVGRSNPWQVFIDLHTHYGEMGGYSAAQSLGSSSLLYALANYFNFNVFTFLIIVSSLILIIGICLLIRQSVVQKGISYKNLLISNIKTILLTLFLVGIAWWLEYLTEFLDEIYFSQDSIRYNYDSESFIGVTVITSIIQYLLITGLAIFIAVMFFRSIKSIYHSLKFKKIPERLKSFLQKGGSEDSIRETDFVLTIGLVVSLLFSPLSWTHYYVLLIPTMLYLLRQIPINESIISFRKFAFIRLLSIVSIIIIAEQPFIETLNLILGNSNDLSFLIFSAHQVAVMYLLVISVLLLWKGNKLFYLNPREVHN